MVNEKPLKKLSASLDEIKYYYTTAGIRIPFYVFVGALIILGIGAVLLVQTLNLGTFMSIVAFLTIVSMVVVIPLNAHKNRIDQIENNLPDALKHIALILKAGGTTEVALEEVANADYGPLSSELKIGLKQMREGKTFETVIVEAATTSGSLLFQRTALIIVDAKRSGAGLAEIMFTIAEDARDVLHIKRERKSRTTMHVLFMFVSGILLGPFIFGFAISIVAYIGMGIAASTKASVTDLCGLNLILTIFIVLQVIISVLAIGMIRVGNSTKYITYAPGLVLGALIIFEVGRFATSLIVGGKPFLCT